jgi:hypothetical protein
MSSLQGNNAAEQDLLDRLERQLETALRVDDHGTFLDRAPQVDKDFKNTAAAIASLIREQGADKTCPALVSIALHMQSETREGDWAGCIGRIGIELKRAVDAAKKPPPSTPSLNPFQGMRLLGAGL